MFETDDTVSNIPVSHVALCRRVWKPVLEILILVFTDSLYTCSEERLMEEHKDYEVPDTTVSPRLTKPLVYISAPITVSA